MFLMILIRNLGKERNNFIFLYKIGKVPKHKFDLFLFHFPVNVDHLAM